MGFLSVRFNSKSLLLLGVVTHCIVALFCPLTPNFITFAFCYAFAGVGLATLQPQSVALVGHYFPVEERPKKIGYLIAGVASTMVIGSPLMGYIGDWRLSFQLYMLPVCVIVLVLVLKGLPPVRQSLGIQLMEGVKAIVKNHSALACILANIFGALGNKVLDTFAIPFWREYYGVPLIYVSLALAGTSALYVGGSLLGGRLTNRVGKKKLTIISYIGLPAFSAIAMFSPTFEISLISTLAGALLFGVRLTSMSSLALEQVPAYRGSMMSLMEISTGIGFVGGTSLGGVILLLFDYGFIWLLSLMYLVGLFLVVLFIIDPTQEH
jgi:predicted MFS family arabinose efflux permease